MQQVFDDGPLEPVLLAIVAIETCRHLLAESVHLVGRGGAKDGRCLRVRVDMLGSVRRGSLILLLNRVAVGRCTTVLHHELHSFVQLRLVVLLLRRLRLLLREAELVNHPMVR